uniref:Zona pellucida sperm-binding protein 3 n=1 Tax=Notothenia coriiceps TaxID=8208 RepID=A0A193KVS4_9TELE|nr:zona pellucida protein ZPC5 isoform 4 [Notothenia coriiceps]
MEAFNFQVILGLCVSTSFAFPPTRYTQDASFQSLANTGRSELGQQKSPAEEPQQVNTIRVTCHPDSLEIVIKADMFAVGAPVDGDEIRLGVETNNQYCRATASSADEYSISVGLVECGTRHWVTEDSLIYTNLLIYSPEASSYGVVRMDEAVIPIECHYERKYSLSSSSLIPTWIPFTSTQAAVEMLQFNLRIMTSDWQHKRGSNVFHLGEPISIEASVRIGHHIGLRVFVSSCVATLSPDMHSSPRHAFIENGCFVDPQLPGSRSQFLARTQDDKLHMSIDAFRFYNEDRGELYITCHLNAVPINNTDAPNKACSFGNGRWRSADGKDYLCGQCKRPLEVEQTPSKPSSPSKFRPRGFVKPEEREPLWRSGLKTSTVWEHQARVGPMMVLPAKQKSRPIPAEGLSSILDQTSRSTMYGSQWRSGRNRVDQRKGLLPDSVQNKDEEDKNGTDKDAEEVPELLEKSSPEAHLQSKAAVLNSTHTAVLD